MKTAREASGCEACGRRDLSLRWVEFYRVRTFLLLFIRGVESVQSLRCPKHRFIRGLLLGIRCLILFNIYDHIHYIAAFDNFRGGKVITGMSATLMADLASELSRQGKQGDAEEASKLATRYAQQMQKELANIEAAQREAAQREADRQARL